MALFSQAFDGVPALITTSLDVSTAMSRLADLKRWAPGKPLLTGEIKPGRVELAFAPGGGYGRAPSKFEGVLESSQEGCVLRGRFVSRSSVRAVSALMIAICGFMAFGGLLTGLGTIGQAGSIKEMGILVLGLLGWLLAVGVFGSIVLWNAAPARSEIRDMTRYIEGALGVPEGSSTLMP